MLIIKTKGVLTLKIKYFLLIAIALLSSCFEPFDDVSSEQENDFEPLYITRANLDKSIQISYAQSELESPGKIYRYSNYLLIVDNSKGVHIFDNTNPESPNNIAFIKIPGVNDVALEQNILYANNSVDLVAIDISNPQNPIVTNRMRNAFDEPLPPGWFSMPRDQRKENRDADLIIYKWRLKNEN